MTNADKNRKPQVRIGISGWRYEPWRGTFYPKDLTQKRELEFASRKLNSIEINGTFYSLQRPEYFRDWAAQTPDDFVFSLKGPRFITHMRRLKDVAAPLANFLASGVLCLEAKLGPILWQLPPNFAFDADRIEAFLQLLPRTTRDAAKLAQHHDARLKGRAWTKADADRPLRHAIEVRHDSFKDARFIDLLRRHSVALVFADTAGKWPQVEDVTAEDFIYARLHGDEELYVSAYTDAALGEWASRLKAWRDGGEPTDAARVSSVPPIKKRSRDVFVYFDNDVKVRSPFDAMSLAYRLGVTDAPPPEAPPIARAAHLSARPKWPGVRPEQNPDKSASKQRDYRTSKKRKHN